MKTIFEIIRLAKVEAAKSPLYTAQNDNTMESLIAYAQYEIGMIRDAVEARLAKAGEGMVEASTERRHKTS